MLELHLKHPGLSSNASGPLTKHQENHLQNLKHLYRNELDKDCSADAAAYSDSKYLTKRTISEKI